MLLIFGTECTVCIAMMPVVAVVIFAKWCKTKCCIAISWTARCGQFIEYLH